MLVTPDMSDAIERIPAGVYSARVTEYKPTTSKNNVPMGQWKMEIFDSEEWNNRVFTYRTMHAGRGIFTLDNLFKAATGNGIDRKNPNFDSEQIVGVELQVVLVNGQNQDGSASDYPEVKSIVKL